MSKEAQTLITSGYEARRVGRSNEARQLFSEAVEICTATRDPLLPWALTGLGQVERDLKNIPLALEHYVKAANLFRSTSNSLRLAHTIRHVGDIFRQDHRLDEARQCYEEAVALYEQDDNSSSLDVANTLRGYALVCEALGKIVMARSLWQKAKRLHEAANVQAGVEESNHHIQFLAAQ